MLFRSFIASSICFPVTIAFLAVPEKRQCWRDSDLLGLNNRLSILRLPAPELTVPYQILVAIKEVVNGYADEAKLHLTNAAYHVRGEWFTAPATI